MTKLIEFRHRVDDLFDYRTLCKRGLQDEWWTNKNKEVTCPDCLNVMQMKIDDESQADGPELNVIVKDNNLEALEKDRAIIYGDPFLSHQAIGLAWEGVFRNRYHHAFEGPDCEHRPDYRNEPEAGKLFPADLVAEMLAAFKLIRLARPVYKQDSADDAHVYISFSERFRKDKK